MKPLVLPKADYFNELGCCAICDLNMKENVEGLQHDVFYKGKWYSCFCETCKCPGCSWLFQRKCRRKEVEI